MEMHTSFSETTRSVSNTPFIQRPNAVSATFSSIRNTRATGKSRYNLLQQKMRTHTQINSVFQFFYFGFFTSLGDVCNWRFNIFLGREFIWAQCRRYIEILVGAAPWSLPTAWNTAIQLILKINIAMLFLGIWPTNSLCP